MSKSSDIAIRRAAARANGDADYRQRRSDLIEAAAIVFRRKGFPAAKLQDIAEEVGIDRASLYYYISGKEELYEDVVGEAVRKIVREVEDLQTERLPADVKLGEFVQRLMQSYARHYPYLYVFVQENMAHMTDDTPWGREMVQLSRRFDEAVRKIIQQGIDDGLFATEGDSRLIANGIIGICNWSYRWFNPKRGDNSDAVGKVFGDLILNGLRPRS
jgi:TetR/AcrR family transcriptional regulator, cholesterol catabolism regulator